MKRLVLWVWNRGIVSTFLAGLFVVLPIAITLAIIGWLAQYLQAVAGGDSPLGAAMRAIGLNFVSDPTVASVIGGVVVLVGVWFLGLLVKTMTRNRLEDVLQRTVNRIPIVRAIYKPVSQVVDLVKGGDGKSDIRRMAVVFCTFGAGQEGGFLGLLSSDNVYRFAGRDCQAVYIPTSPIPMSGAIVFVPAASVHKVDFPVDDLMKLYFSASVLAPQVIPEQYRVPSDS